MKIPKFKKVFSYAIGGTLAVFAVFLILAATKNNSDKRCKGIITNIKDNSEQFLVTKEDIEKWVTQYGNDPFEGKIMENIALSKVEKRILESGKVKKCEAYFDLQSHLVLDIETFKPIARILNHNQVADRYLDEDGNIFPFSKHFTPTVLLISGNYLQNLKNLKSDKNKDLLKLLNTINEDEFWSAQISQIDVDKLKEIKMIPLLGDNIIEFGRPENINSKLGKLLIFYKQILPQKKWSEFSTISVKYEGQIVCN
ncbi:cell division protein FtsQ [Lacihabitans sp. LS3-19]|uniref:cell division protein FtsQ/DivIB n=1 Tax=Lacihabitans sp. LS3-19 TaxID=2487335 RepID=UPI0020CDD9C9|nr:cell division protein FtsQ/DivIB [Lacihabitans sp. LS3-19]MCP9769192.1 cell division protein FtsQ [Lacihabitans sp. LS3-19]